MPYNGIVAIAADLANLYFATATTIFRAGKDGSNPAEFYPLAGTGFILPHTTGIFVRHGQAISKIALDGTGNTDFYIRQSIASEFLGSMTADTTHLYWTGYYLGTVTRQALSGGPAVTLASGENHPDALLLDAGTLYISTDNGIKTIPAGGGPVTYVASASGDLAKEGAFLYVAGGSALSRVDIRDGSVTSLLTGGTGVYSWTKPAVASDHIYWLSLDSVERSISGSLLRISK